MADSRQYRNRFYLLSIVFVVLLGGVLGFLNVTSELTSGLKIDLTKDKIYTTSEATKEIFGGLRDEVQVTYYCSKELPERLRNLLRDTVVRLEEFKRYSRAETPEGDVVHNIQYDVVDPEILAEDFASERTEKYMNAYNAKDFEGLEEPEQPRNIMDLFGGAPQKSDEDLRTERESRAAARVRETGVTKEQAYRDLIYEEFRDQKINELAQEGIQPYVVQDRVGNSVKQVKVYSSIKITYLDRQPEVIPLHTSLENLEYELAYRILKLTLDEKPIVAFFDPRKPEAPPFNPMQPTPPPQGDHAMVVNFLQELVDVREISLAEGDAIDDLVKRLKVDALRKEKEDAGDDGESVSEDSVSLEPGDYKKFLKGFVVAQPSGLEKRQVFEINRVVSLGIPTIFVVSRFSLDVSREGAQRGIPINQLQPGLDDLFRKWGFELGSDMLASNTNGMISILQQLRGTRMLVNQPTPLAAVVAAGTDTINKEALLTSGLQSLVFPATTGIELVPKTLEANGISAEELVNTSEETWSVQINPFANANNPFQRGQPGATIQNYIEDLARGKDPERFRDWSGEKLLAVYLRGKFPFVYEGETVPNWEPKPEPTGEEADPHGGIPGFPGGLPGAGRDLLPDADDPLQDTSPEEPPAVESEGDGTVDEATSSSVAPGAADDQVGGAETEAGPPAGPGEAGPPSGSDAGGAAEPAEKAHVEVAEGKVVVLASADMLRNDYLSLSREFPGYYFNAEFFRNVVQIFTLHDKMVQIRRKNLSVREFSEGSDKAAPWIIFLNLVGVPLCVAGIGLLRFLVRRGAAVGYERDYIRSHSTGGGAAKAS